MTELQKTLFTTRFKQAIDYWGLDSFVDAHLEMAEKRTRDLSEDEMRALCDLLIDNCDRVPSIVKIVSFASMVRAKRQRIEPKVELSVNCHRCDDLGVVKVEHKAFGTLAMRCGAKCRTSVWWDLPTWGPQYEKDFLKSKFPPSWFRPASGQSFWERAEDWKDFLKISKLKFDEMVIKKNG